MSKSKYRRLNIQLEPELISKLDEVASEIGLERAALIRVVLWLFIKVITTFPNSKVKRVLHDSIENTTSKR